MPRKKPAPRVTKAMPGHLDTGTEAQKDAPDEILTALTTQMVALHALSKVVLEIALRMEQQRTVVPIADPLKDKAVRRTPQKPEPPVPTASEIAQAVLTKAAEHITPSAPKAAEKIKDIQPVPVGKSVNDLRAALQECIAKRGMGVAKERLLPHAKMSEVPDAEIEATIERLMA